MKHNRQVIRVGVETVYKTDIVPTQDLPVENLTFSPMQGPTTKQETVSPGYGASLTIHTAPYSKLSFDIPATGSGTAGVKPLYADAVEACGRNMVETAVTDTVSKPVSSNESSLSIYFNWDGERHVLLGSRGSASLTMGANGYPVIRCELLGVRANPTAVALPAPDFTGFVRPVPFNDDNTNFTFDGYSAVLHSLTLSDNPAVSHRNLPNDESINIEDRDSGGSMVIDLPLIASKDIHALIQTEATGVLQLIHGLAAGNILTVDCPRVQLVNPSFSNGGGFLTLSCDLVIMPSVEGADDDMSLTWT